METTRSHDKFYLKEDRKRNPKESFKFIIERADLASLATGASIIDVGCATGDFLWYANECYPHLDFTGMDVDTELLERAAEENPFARFVQGDIQNPPTDLGKFDAVFMIGVLSIFDDFKPSIDAITSMLRDASSKAYIFGIFNPEDLDVLLQVRKSNTEGAWELGWNCFSKASLAAYVAQLGYDGDFVDFTIPIDIARKEDDPLRSWTEKLETGERIIFHGTQLVHRFSLWTISTTE